MHLNIKFTDVSIFFFLIQHLKLKNVLRTRKQLFKHISISIHVSMFFVFVLGRYGMTKVDLF